MAQSKLLATMERASKVLGKSWRAARDNALNMVNSGYQLITIIGRAGSGKTHIALNICGELRKSGLCLFVDASQLPDKKLGTVLSVALRVNEDHVAQLIKIARSRKLSGNLGRFVKLSVSEMAAAALNYPVDTLTLLHDALSSVGFNIVAITIDEGALSQDDPSIGSFISTVHALRNLMPRLDKLRLVLTLLPDVVDYIAKSDAPLFEILSMGVVNLPDYVSEDDLAEIIQAYGLSEELVNFIRSTNLTIRQVICLAELKDLAKCGIHGEVEVTIT